MKKSFKKEVRKEQIKKEPVDNPKEDP